MKLRQNFSFFIYVLEMQLLHGAKTFVLGCLMLFKQVQAYLFAYESTVGLSTSTPYLWAKRRIALASCGLSSSGQ